VLQLDGEGQDGGGTVTGGRCGTAWPRLGGAPRGERDLPRDRRSSEPLLEAMSVQRRLATTLRGSASSLADPACSRIP
jgi:hypothetical protein